MQLFNRPLMTALLTAGLTAGLVGGIGLTAFSQQAPAEDCARGGRGHGPDLAATAADLGVSEAELKDALGLPAERPERPDLAVAAAQLGISKANLEAAMRNARQEQMDQRQANGQGERSRGGRGAALASVATQLGVSEAELKDALGLPAERPERPDLAAAAAQLGISETDLQAALRNNMPERPERGERHAH